MRFAGILLASLLLAGCVPRYVRRGMDSDLRVGLLRDESGHFRDEDLVRFFTKYEDPGWSRPLPHFKNVVKRSSLEKTRDCDLMVRLCFTGTGPEDLIRAEVHSAFTLEKIATVESTVEEEFPPGFGGIGLRVLETFRPDSKLYARIIAERMGCPANHLRGPAAGILHLQGISHTLRRDVISEETAGEGPGWYLIPPGERTKYWVMLRNGNRLTRIRSMPDNTLLADLPAGEPDEEPRVRELFWQITRSRAWERAGDLRLPATAPLAAKIAAADAWEKGWRDEARSATLPSKLAAVFGEILRTPDAAEPLKRYACRALLALPPAIPGALPEQARYSLDRACAYYFAGCLPRSVEALRHAGFGPDAAGLRTLLRILGTDAFVPLQGVPAEPAGYRVSGWRCTSTPGDPALPRLLMCVVVESPDGLRTYSLTRRPLGDRARHYLHRTQIGEETLVGMFGEEPPPDAVVLDRIAADVPRREDASAPPGGAVREEGAALPGTATLEIEGSPASMGTTVELRKGPRLLAGLWFEPDPRKPVREITVPAGVYEVLIQTAGRQTVRDLTLELKGRSRLPLETP